MFWAYSYFISVSWLIGKTFILQLTDRIFKSYYIIFCSTYSLLNICHDIFLIHREFHVTLYVLLWTPFNIFLILIDEWVLITHIKVCLGVQNVKHRQLKAMLKGRNKERLTNLKNSLHRINHWDTQIIVGVFLMSFTPTFTNDSWINSSLTVISLNDQYYDKKDCLFRELICWWGNFFYIIYLIWLDIV